MSEFQYEGTFRGQIVSYGLHEAESGAKAVNLRVTVEEAWWADDEGVYAWRDWREYGFAVDGSIWVVKKDGSLNENSVRSLMENAGWEANFRQLSEQTWEPRPIQFTVEEDTYKDELRYRIGFINAYDATPGGGNVSPETARQLDDVYGGALRALAGTMTRNAAKPAGAPTKGPGKPAPQTRRPAKKAKAPEKPQADEALPAGDEIPF